MTREPHILIALITAALAACSAATDSPPAESAAASSPLPSRADVAEIELDIGYDVLGNPVVGQPVAIGLRLRIMQQPASIILSYRPGDTSSMNFPESQASEVELVPAPDQDVRIQQVTVIPQREGRLYLNVSAEMTTADGSAVKTIAVPILVDAAAESAPRTAVESDEDSEEQTPPPEDDTAR
jgi:hypothetical protein